MNISLLRKRALEAGVAVPALALMSAAFAAPAFAQATPAPVTAPPTATSDSPADAAANDKIIVVTGTLLRNLSDTNIASPVTTLTSEDLAARGVSTVQQAIQTLASNGGPALTNSFTANGAFAGGASGASLRGLTTNSTLVLFDGLRAAYYPLADDGSRNFVDLNTIPDEIVDRIEVLRDGASSTYGADAVAGVINIITKRQITGLSGMAEAGMTEHQDAGNQRVSLTYGIGDLATNRVNFYISGHYVHQSLLRSNQRGYPYNTDNQTGICFNGNCGIDNRQNSPINFSGISTIEPAYLVRPYNAANTAAIPGGAYQFLNPGQGCNGYPSYTLTAAERANFPTSPPVVCTTDSVGQAGVIEPELERWGGSARASFDIGDNHHGYAEFNFEQSTVRYTGFGLAGSGLPVNATIRANAPAGIFYPRFSTSTAANAALDPGSFVLALPVYICPRTTVGPCTNANGTLNPNNPFAASNEVARIIGQAPDISQEATSRSRVYRLAGGINGTFGGNWDYRVDGVGMVNDLVRGYDGYVYIQHLLDVIKDGSYNFVDPFANTQATRDYLAPHLDALSQSQLYQANASLSHPLFSLPGGPAQLAVGASWRYESVNSPSANSDVNGPTQRYFIINAFGTVGHRQVWSGYGELNAPILDMLTLDLSGRYDHYSTGQSAFSPKAGVVFTPIRQLTLRGTISKGFRIPSFGESSALPTTGYVPYALSQFPNSYLAQYSNPGVTCNNTTPANCSSYVTVYSVGEQSSANPNLQPEKSRNITLGVEIKPIRNLRITIDAYDIKKTNAIITQTFSSALNAYYAGQPIPPGYTIVQNAPDVNHPGATPTVAVVGAQYINATTVLTNGLDFAVDWRFPLWNGWTFSTNAEAEYIHKLDTIFPDGHVERYAGTLGNFNLTAGTGSQHWKGSWQNTLEFGDIGSITATAYYVSGYNLSAEDQEGPGTAGDCGLSAGIQACDVKAFIDVDLTGTYNVTPNATVYVNVLNVLNAKAPLDTATYGGYLYNPVQAEQGMIGRAYRIGARFKL